jgi:hypothetical protein
MKHKIDLLFSKGCIKVKEAFIPCFTNKGDPKCCRISVAETVEIPPESEKIIKGQVCGIVKYDSVGIVESNEIFVENTGLLIINAGVQHTSNVIPLRVSNFSHQPVTVHRNTIAAKFEPADVRAVVNRPITRVHCVNVSPGLDLPEHLTELYVNVSPGLDLPEHLTELYVNVSPGLDLPEHLTELYNKSSKASSDFGYTELIQHGINTGNVPPIKQTSNRIPLAKR